MKMIDSKVNNRGKKKMAPPDGWKKYNSVRYLSLDQLSWAYLEKKGKITKVGYMYVF